MNDLELQAAAREILDCCPNGSKHNICDHALASIVALVEQREREVIKDSSVVWVHKKLEEHAESIGLWGLEGLILDQKVMAGTASPHDKDERDAMVTERRAIAIISSLLKEFASLKPKEQPDTKGGHTDG